MIGKDFQKAKSAKCTRCGDEFEYISSRLRTLCKKCQGSHKKKCIECGKKTWMLANAKRCNECRRKLKEQRAQQNTDSNKYAGGYWTDLTKECYSRGCVCIGCYYNNFFTEHQCQMKYTVIELVKKLGLPKDIQVVSIEKGEELNNENNCK